MRTIKAEQLALLAPRRGVLRRREGGREGGRERGWEGGREGGREREREGEGGMSE